MKVGEEKKTREGNGHKTAAVETIATDFPAWSFLNETNRTKQAEADANSPLIDTDGEDGPPTLPDKKRGRRRRKLVFLLLLLLLTVAGLAGGFYLFTDHGRTEINMLVKDQRPQQRGTGASSGSPSAVDAETKAAIEDVKREADYGQGRQQQATPQAVATPLPGPVPGETPQTPNIGATVTGRVTDTTISTPHRPNAPVTDVDPSLALQAANNNQQMSGAAAHQTGSQTARGQSTTTAANTAQSTGRNTERSIRLDVQSAKSTSNTPTLPPSPINLPPQSPANESGSGLPTKRSSVPASSAKREEPALKPAKAAERAIVLPAFGTMLPVKTLGALYTLRTGALARLELTRDMQGEGWSMRRGTTLVGMLGGSEQNRAFISLVGFIDPQSQRFVKLTGDLLGGDGGSGLKGKRRKVGSTWARAFSRVGAAGVELAGTAVSGLGRRNTVIISDGYGQRVVNPVTHEISSLMNGTGDRRREFVEVAAGTTGYVMVTHLPKSVSGTDPLAAIGENFDREMEEVLGDGETAREATGLTEKELAELISNGTPD